MNVVSSLVETTLCEASLRTSPWYQKSLFDLALEETLHGRLID